jgi:hypothetical protein
MPDLEETYLVPTDILDRLWPSPVPLWRLKLKHERDVFLDHLDRYVDMGVLSRSGSGTPSDPFRFEWVVAPPDMNFIGFRPSREVLELPIPHDVPRDLLLRAMSDER